jgi:hypothetical protein
VYVEKKKSGEIIARKMNKREELRTTNVER